MLDNETPPGVVSTDQAYPGFEEKIEAEPGPEPTTPAAPDVPGQAPADAAVQPPAGTEAQPAAGTSPEAPQYTEWYFRADGRDVPLTGSKQGSDGVFLPNESLEQVQQLLAEGQAHRGSWRQREQHYQSQIEQLKSQRDPEVLKAGAFNRALLGLMQQGPQAVAEWLDSYSVNFPRLQAEAERSVYQAQLQEQQAQLEAFQEEQAAAQMAPQIEGTLDNVLTELQRQPEYQGVDFAGIRERLVGDHIDQIVYEVPANLRPSGPQEGEIELGRGAKGEWYILNHGRIAREVAYEARLRGTAQSAATRAIQQNTAALAPGQVPPVVGAAGGIAQGEQPRQMPTFKTAKDMQEWWDKGGWRQLARSQ